MLHISAPSRICLFGEHQDYLGLEVIASAIDLRFEARVTPRSDRFIAVRIRDSRIGALGEENTEGLYESFRIDLDQPIVYENNRDYFRSCINVLRKNGIEPVGCDIRMDSTIPIGKGMCSSTTMVMAYMTALTVLVNPELARDASRMALLAWKAEVEEFGEPGGMMDHYASALGGLCHMDFSDGTRARRLDAALNGVFILIDSLQRKDTIGVLSRGKYPTLEALESLHPYGIQSIRDFYADPSLERYLDKLDELHQQKVRANINNFRIQREALALLEQPVIDDEKLGALLNEHQANLRDGVGASTPLIDELLELARKNGAYGGKFNGSGGGGCLFVYAAAEKSEQIIRAVREAGYPAVELHQSKGLSIEEES